MERYMRRIADGMLADRLRSKDAVLIEGPKWCGKTTTAQQQAGSALYLQDPRTRAQNLQLAQLDPSILLQGDAPRLLDEWQDAPALWDAVRFEADRRGEFGQFILTGSTVPPNLGTTAHSGTGRIARMRMRTMSLFESGDSNGAVALGDLFAGPVRAANAQPCSLQRLAFLVCRGGWPRAVGEDDDVALRQAPDYLDAVAAADISRIDGVSRSETTARGLLRSYARMSASQGSLESIRSDMRASGTPVAESTLAGYLEALRRLFVVEDLEAWSPNLRSKTAIRTSPTRHLSDPSIAAAALGASPADLIGDLNTFGLLFETLCVRDLRIYADALGGTVAHYRDKSGLECDAVVHLRDGRYGLAEVKLGGQQAVDEGAASLRKLVGRIDTDSMRAPSFLAVVTGLGDAAYRRPDGVTVVPITALGA